MREAWLAVALFFAVAALAAAALSAAGSLTQRFVAGQLAGAIGVLCIVALAAGMEASGFYDVALTAVLATFAGTMIVARFVERWM